MRVSALAQHVDGAEKEEGKNKNMSMRIDKARSETQREGGKWTAIV